MYFLSYAFVAQLVEQLALNETVAGSNPAGGTHNKKTALAVFLLCVPPKKCPAALLAGFEAVLPYL